MIRIRLARYGKRNSPFYRIVAVEKRSKRTGKFLENLGYWNPLKKELLIREKKIEAWVSNGAKLSDTVRKLIESKN